MHTAFPSFNKDLNNFTRFMEKKHEFVAFLRDVAERDDIFFKHFIKIPHNALGFKDTKKFTNRLVGGGMARFMSDLLKYGLAFIIHIKGMEFFKSNFEEININDKSDVHYYNGRFLFRTDKPGDNMNVLLSFCPDQDNLFKDNGAVDPFAVVSTKLMKEKEADAIQYDMDKVDFVIYLKDVKTMFSLAFGGQNLDLVGMLMNNMMHVKGNVGHIFKFGAIGQNIMLAFKRD